MTKTPYNDREPSPSERKIIDLTDVYFNQLVIHYNEALAELEVPIGATNDKRTLLNSIIDSFILRISNHYGPINLGDIVAVFDRVAADFTEMR